jgi:hypothetical protein
MNVLSEGIVETDSTVRARVSQGSMSWAAILAGAVAAAALSLILLSLGLGLGLSSISPWSYQGASSSKIATGTIIWLLVTSLCASGLGGYIAGRMRNLWNDVDEAETHFRDTVHGFLAWAVATLIGAAILSSAAASIVGTAVKTGAGAATVATAAGTSSVAAAADPSASYFIDMMFRGAKSNDAGGEINGAQRQARTIVANSISGDMSAGDRAYLTQLVTSQTGLPQPEAEVRVNQIVTAEKLAMEAAAAKAKEVAETTRKVTAYTALWVFISLLVGAFYSSLAATWGGRQRDPMSYVRHAV